MSDSRGKANPGTGSLLQLQDHSKTIIDGALQTRR